MCTAAPGFEVGAARITLRFAVDASSILGNPIMRTQFIIQFQNGLAATLGIPSQRIIVVSMSEGSLLVEFLIIAGTPSADQLAAQVEAKVEADVSIFSPAFFSSFGISPDSVSIVVPVGQPEIIDVAAGQRPDSDSFPIVRRSDPHPFCSLQSEALYLTSCGSNAARCTYVCTVMAGGCSFCSCCGAGPVLEAEGRAVSAIENA